MSENKMPGMPGMNLELKNEVVKPTLPEINNPSTDVSNDISIPMIPKTGIKVVATRKGFFGQLRLAEGNEFTVYSSKQFGDWFKCVDPVFEKQRKQFIKDKKAKK